MEILVKSDNEANSTLVLLITVAMSAIIRIVFDSGTYGPLVGMTLAAVPTIMRGTLYALNWPGS